MSLNKKEKNIRKDTYVQKKHSPILNLSKNKKRKFTKKIEDLKIFKSKPRITVLEKILYTLFVAFIISFIFFLTIFFSGFNEISVDNVSFDIEISTPIVATEKSTLTFIIKNNNRIPIESVNANVILPNGFFDENLEKINSELFTLDSINPMEEIRKEFSYFIFGQSLESKELNFKIEYRQKSSSQVLEKEKSFPIIVNESPISLNVLNNSLSISGNNYSIEYMINSSSEKEINDIYLLIDFPKQFTYIDSSLKPISYSKSNNFFKIGSVSVNNPKKLIINGIIDSSSNEEVSFKSTIGKIKSEIDVNIDSILSEIVSEVKVENKPFKAKITLENLEIDNYNFFAGKGIEGEVFWENSSNLKILDGELKLTFSGPIFNLNGFQSTKGDFILSRKSLILNKKNLEDFKKINPQEKNSFNFEFDLVKDDILLSQLLQNPSGSIKASFEGRYLDEQTEKFEKIKINLFEKKININSVIDITTDPFSAFGQFKNSGPLPPKVGLETSYTIRSVINNSYNKVSDAQIKYSLPFNVKYLGKYKASQGNLMYDQAKGQLIWNIGQIDSLAGYAKDKIEIYFQIAIEPTPIQIDNKAILLHNIIFEAKDEFTNNIFLITLRNQTTETKKDSTTEFSHYNVVE